MKKFLIIWLVTIVTIGVGFVIYMQVDAKKQQDHRHEVYKMCSQKAYDNTVDYVDKNDKKAAYNLQYSNCIRTH